MEVSWPEANVIYQEGQDQWAPKNHNILVLGGLLIYDYNYGLVVIVKWDPGSLDFLEKCVDNCHNGMNSRTEVQHWTQEPGPRTCKPVSPL